jgi:hypothetical protein
MKVKVASPEFLIGPSFRAADEQFRHQENLREKAKKS